MAWQPGLPVRTAADEFEWQAWRRARKLEQQRERRKANPRIDYYPGKEAREVIERLWRPTHCGDYSSVIDGLVLAAADLPE